MTRIRGLRGNLKSRSAGLFDVIARMWPARCQTRPSRRPR